MIGINAGWAVGFLVPTLAITGPVESFRSVLGDNGTFNGTFPNDWRNEEKWSQNITQLAMGEVTEQMTLIFTSFAAVCALLFFSIVVVVRDSPPNPPSGASRKQNKAVNDRRYCIFNNKFDPVI